VKHSVLESYLIRLMMIVGQKRADTIGFVDAFAGPWQSATSDLSDTSIGIALEQMEKAHAGFLDRNLAPPRFSYAPIIV